MLTFSKMRWVQSCFEAKVCLYSSYIMDVTSSQPLHLMWKILPFLCILILDWKSHLLIIWIWVRYSLLLWDLGKRVITTVSYGMFWPFYQSLRWPSYKGFLPGAPRLWGTPKKRKQKHLSRLFFVVWGLQQVNGGSLSTCLVRPS